MIRLLLMLGMTFVLSMGCKSQKTEEVEEPAPIEQEVKKSIRTIHMAEGTYEASVDVTRVEDDLRAYNQTSKIGFSFEADQKFIYMVRAMGKEIDDVGKWQIINDSLYIYDLERGPNTAFHIEETGLDTYRISGPNVFTLTKVAEAPAPIKN